LGSEEIEAKNLHGLLSFLLAPVMFAATVGAAHPPFRDDKRPA
jgi:hypothetical protein